MSVDAHSPKDDLNIELYETVQSLNVQGEQIYLETWMQDIYVPSSDKKSSDSPPKREEAKYACDALFKMTDSYRQIWQHEDNLYNSRIMRFWVVNTALFAPLSFMLLNEEIIEYIKTSLKDLLYWNPHTIFGSFDTHNVLYCVIVSVISFFGIINTSIFLNELSEGQKAVGLLYVKYKEFLLTLFPHVTNPDVFREFIKTHNLTGMSLFPPFFGTYSCTTSRLRIDKFVTDNKSFIISENSNSHQYVSVDLLRGKVKEGRSSLIRDIFRTRGLVFLFVWLFLESCCLTYLVGTFIHDKNIFNIIILILGLYWSLRILWSWYSLNSGRISKCCKAKIDHTKYRYEIACWKRLIFASLMFFLGLWNVINYDFPTELYSILIFLSIYITILILIEFLADESDLTYPCHLIYFKVKPKK